MPPRRRRGGKKKSKRQKAEQTLATTPDEPETLPPEPEHSRPQSWRVRPETSVETTKTPVKKRSSAWRNKPQTSRDSRNRNWLDVPQTYDDSRLSPSGPSTSDRRPLSISPRGSQAPGARRHSTSSRSSQSSDDRRLSISPRGSQTSDDRRLSISSRGSQSSDDRRLSISPRGSKASDVRRLSYSNDRPQTSDDTRHLTLRERQETSYDRRLSIPRDITEISDERRRTITADESDVFDDTRPSTPGDRSENSAEILDNLDNLRPLTPVAKYYRSPTAIVIEDTSEDTRPSTITEESDTINDAISPIPPDTPDLLDYQSSTRTTLRPLEQFEPSSRPSTITEESDNLDNTRSSTPPDRSNLIGNRTSTRTTPRAPEQFDSLSRPLTITEESKNFENDNTTSLSSSNTSEHDNQSSTRGTPQPPEQLEPSSHPSTTAEESDNTRSSTPSDTSDHYDYQPIRTAPRHLLPEPTEVATSVLRRGAPRRTYECNEIIMFLVIFFVMSSTLFLHVTILTNRVAQLPAMNLDQWWGPESEERRTLPDTSVRPFQIEFSDNILNALTLRLSNRRDFTPPLQNVGFAHGFRTTFLTKLLDYWQYSYDFKKQEEYLNSYPHFKTTIQGLEVHYIHVVPDHNVHKRVVPLLMIHSWPGSVYEFYRIIPHLNKSREDYDFVFELIIPSLPGFGFSQAPSRPGFGLMDTSILLYKLMRRIGYNQFYIHTEGNIGSMVGNAMATMFPGKIRGLHMNSPVILSKTGSKFIECLDSLWNTGLVDPNPLQLIFPLGGHFLHIQSSKEDTIGIALTDSPAGLLTYILERFSAFANYEDRGMWKDQLVLTLGIPQLLDNVMLYWASNCITTSIRLYAEIFSRKTLRLQFDKIPTKVPTWCIKFKDEIPFHPDFALKEKFINYIQTTEIEISGHFGAWEAPRKLADDLFKATQAFFKFHGERYVFKKSRGDKLYIPVIMISNSQG